MPIKLVCIDVDDTPWHDPVHCEAVMAEPRRILSPFFFAIEIVGETFERTYKRVAQRHGHPMAWSSELAELPSSAARFKIADRPRHVGPWLGEIG